MFNSHKEERSDDCEEDKRKPLTPAILKVRGSDCREPWTHETLKLKTLETLKLRILDLNAAFDTFGDSME